MDQRWVDDEGFLVPPNYGGGEKTEGTEEGIDEFLAPPADVVVVDDFVGGPLDDPEAEDEGWSPEQGFRDGHRIVRLWVNEDGLLTRIKLSDNWRHKLGGESLEAAFVAAFMSMNAVLHTGEHRIPDPEPLPVVAYEGTAGWHTLRRAERELAEIDAKLDALGDVPPTRWVGELVEGTALSRSVVVRLGIFGEPEGVWFDPDWLAGPLHPRVISRAVLDAYRRARAKYQPPHVEYGERELLLREYDRITDSMMATLRNDFEM